MSAAQAEQVVSYLRSVAGTKRSAATGGNVERGKAVFAAKGACVTCHRVDGVGARLGVNPFITTLGTMVLIRGVVYLFTGGAPIEGERGVGYMLREAFDAQIGRAHV